MIEGLRLEGIIPAMVTPFTPRGQVDIEGIKTNLRFVLDAGVSGVLCNGTTGEGVTLTREERTAVIETTKAALPGGTPLLAASGAPSTEMAITLTKEASTAGCDAVLVVPPYYERPSRAGIVAHYAAIADAVDIPIVLYNAPQHTGYHLDSQTVEQVAAQARVVGMKDASGDLLALSWLTSQLGETISFLSGCDDLLLPSFAIGASGAVIAVAAFAPSLAVEAYRSWQQGAVTPARALHRKLLRVVAGVCQEENFPAGVKEALRQRGLPAGSPRMPILPATEDEARRIGDVLADTGLVASRLGGGGEDAL